ncbi:uncharacterized protein LOC135373750 [Ornithodoros turicata]
MFEGMALLLFLLLLWSEKSFAETNKYLKMSSLCAPNAHKHVQPLKIDGAVLTSEEDFHADSCTTTFQTDSILQRLMLRFERLTLNCDTHMDIFDAADAVGEPKITLSCGKNESQVGTIQMQSNFVTLKYRTKSTFRDSGFKLILTSYRPKLLPGVNDKHHCGGFECRNTSFCISSDLKCDGINHCGDDSDEADSCANNEKTTSTRILETSPESTTFVEFPTTSREDVTSPTYDTIASVQSTPRRQEADTYQQETCESWRGGMLDTILGGIGIPTHVCYAGYFVYGTIKSLFGY